MGTTKSDLWPFVSICTVNEDGYGFTEELNGTMAQHTCTESEWSDAVNKSDDETDFEAHMSTVFGSAWDDLPDTTANPAKDVCRKAFSDVRVAT